MSCGEEAFTEVKRKFSWYPPWVNVFILLGGLGVVLVIILASIMTKKMTVQAPMCMDHQNHWRSRNLSIWGSFLGLGAVGLLALAIALGTLLDWKQDRPDASIPAFICVGIAAFFVVWLIIVCIVQAGAIKPSEITDNTITLVKVHRRFVDALDQREQEEWESRPRRRRSVDEDNDEYFDPGERKRRPWPRDGFRDADR